MSSIRFIVFACLVASIHCAPLDNTITNSNAENEVKKGVPVSSVDQVLSSAAKVSSKVEETTTSGQLFNNNEPEEDKMFKLNEADDLLDLAPSSKQASSGGMPNVQSLIDQTNTISSNLENMIKDMTQNKRHATATMLKLMLQNVRRLNTSLVRLNNRVNSLPIIGSSPGSASSSGSTSLSSSSSASSAASSVSSSVSNATINAASQINSVVTNIRNQLNNVSNEINNLLSRIRLSMPGSGSSKPSTTPSG